ncbi:MAG TPA: PEP-CTERM sorting domain-containing protein [Verrucomicrobiae bacterium]|nr:PEP-CTERM sorting domain-containing protein [Verrucomicrobiae bacterium]
MNNQIKTIVLAAVSVASLATAAHAQLGGVYTQGDLLAGFTTGSGTDLILNLGLQSSVTDGESWDITSLVGAGVPAGLFSSPSSVIFGVIGDNSGPNTIFTTTAGTNPNHFASQSAFNTADAALSGAGSLLNGSTGFGTPSTTASGQTSWFGQTVGGGTGTIKNSYGNPDGGAGQASLNFYTIAQGSTGSRTLEATFSLSQNGSGDEVLSYSVVPEPSTTALAGFAGLIGLWARNRKKLS